MSPAIKIKRQSRKKRKRIEAELAALCEEREREARERMREDATWYALRKLYPPPAAIEGVTK